MKIAIVGAKGFIGQHLTNYLRSKGHEVAALSSQLPGLFDLRSGMLSETFEFSPGTEVVYYLSQSPYYRHAADHIQHIYNVNTLGASRLARKARAAGVKRFLYMSSGNVYAHSFESLHEDSSLNRKDAYALSKIHAEELLAIEARDGMKVVCARLFGIFGPQQKDMIVQKISQRVIANEPIQIDMNPADAADRNGIKISYLFVDSAVAVLEALSECPSASPVMTINVAGPRGVGLLELGETIGKHLQREPRFEYVDRMRSNDLVADTSRLTKLVRFEPISFGAGLNLSFPSLETAAFQ